VLGFESVPGGVPTGSTGGGRGRPRERETRKGKKAPQKAGTGTDPVWRPLLCPCVAMHIAALSPITVLRLNV
jgi:hypothetical protein